MWIVQIGSKSEKREGEAEMGKDTLNEQIQNLGLYFPHLVNHPFRV